MGRALKISFENVYSRRDTLRSLPGHTPLPVAVGCRRAHHTGHNLKLGSKVGCRKWRLTVVSQYLSDGAA